MLTFSKTFTNTQHNVNELPINQHCKYIQKMLKNERFGAVFFVFLDFFYIFASKINISLEILKFMLYLLIKNKFIIMDKKINGEAQQVEEASEKIFNTLRDWSESEYQEEMTFLGIDDSNISLERKKILVILYMLSGVKDKDGWFYIDNANLCEICGVNERTITRTKRDFERLGIIKIKRGCKGYPTRYKFFESKIGRLPKISKKTPESTLSTLSGSDFLPANIDEIRKSITASALGSCIGLVDKVDSKTEEKKLAIEGGVQYKEEEQDKEKKQYSDKYGDANVYKEGDAKQYSYKNGDIEQYEDEERYEDKEQDIDKDGLVMENTRIEELLIKLIEKVDSIYNLINDDRRVQSEVNIKLLEGIKKLHSSISSSKNSKETVSSITTNNKEVQSSVNKETTVTTNCNERYTSSSTSTLDKIMSFQVRSLEEQEQQTSKLQEASKQTSEANTNTRVIDKYMEGERQETIKKLECEITKPFINSIVHANSYENLLKIRKDFKNEFNKCYTIHQDVLNKSDVYHLIDKFYEAYDKKEKELKQEPSSNVESQVEDNNTNDSEQKPSNEKTVEATDVETSPKEDETDNTRFQHNYKTSTDSENCQEKEDSTAEHSTVESKKVQVSETYTPNCEEKSQDELDKEFDKETSTMFLIDDSKKTVQTKKVEEVKFPKTEKIVLNEEEQKQFQELVNNQAINGLLKCYSSTDGDKYEVILTEIRKAVTRGKYKERLAKAYIDYIWDTYKSFDCEVKDAMKPIEITNEDAVTTTTSTPKGDSFDEFKNSLDNIENNVKECGDNLPFGKNPKSRYQDDEEETVEESNSDEPTDEEIAMAATSPYDETKDAIF